MLLHFRPSDPFYHVIVNTQAGNCRQQENGQHHAVQLRMEDYFRRSETPVASWPRFNYRKNAREEIKYVMQVYRRSKMRTQMSSVRGILVDLSEKKKM